MVITFSKMTEEGALEPYIRKTVLTYPPFLKYVKILEKEEKLDKKIEEKDRKRRIKVAPLVHLPEDLF